MRSTWRSLFRRERLSEDKSLSLKYQEMKLENLNSGFPFQPTSMWNNILGDLEKVFFKVNTTSEHLRLTNKYFTHSDISNPRYYDYATTLLYNFLVSDGAKGFLDRLEMNFQVDVRVVTLGEKKLNWDVLTAFYVLWKIYKEVPDLFTRDNLVIAELGSGHGKHAQVLLMLNKNLKYLCFDLPLPLIVAEEVLNSRLSDVSIHGYPLELVNSIDPNTLNHGIHLFGSHHLPLVRDMSIDVFINTSSFQEMTREQVSCYLEIISVKCKNLVFLQNYWKHKNQSKLYGNILGWEEYAFPKNMFQKSIQNCHYSNRYFEAVLKMKNADL